MSERDIPRMRIVVDPNTGYVEVEEAPFVPSEDDVAGAEVVASETFEDAVAKLARAMGARHTRLK